MSRGRRRYSSVVRVAREVDVCGVKPVDVRDAAAWPVVCRDLWAVVEGLVASKEVVAEGGETSLEDWRDLRVEAIESRFEARASGLMSGSCFRSLGLGLRTAAPLPRAVLLTLREWSSCSACCSGVRVLAPSCRYLKLLRLRGPTFCGSCRTTMSFLLNSSSLTKSLQFLTLMLRRSTVS